MKTCLNCVGDLESLKIYDRYGAGRSRAVLCGDDRGAIGILLEIASFRSPSSLVGDIGGLAIRRDDDTLRHIADADRLPLDWLRLCQVDLNEGIVVVEDGIGGLAILRDRDAEG